MFVRDSHYIPTPTIICKACTGNALDLDAVERSLALVELLELMRSLDELFEIL